MMTDVNGNGPQGLIEQALAPLVQQREVLLEERAAIKERLDAKDAEIKTVDRVLRAGGLIEAPHPAKQGKGKKAYGQSGVSIKMMVRVRDAIDVMEQPFTNTQLADRLGVSDATVRKAIEKLRAGGELRLVGARVPKTGGRVPAAHYEMIGG